jgi:hypothetical protein
MKQNRLFAPISKLEPFIESIINFLKQKNISEIADTSLEQLEKEQEAERQERNAVNVALQNYLQLKRVYIENRAKRYRSFANTKKVVGVLYALDPEYKALFGIRKKRKKQTDEPSTEKV